MNPLVATTFAISLTAAVIFTGCGKDAKEKCESTAYCKYDDITGQVAEKFEYYDNDEETNYVYMIQYYPSGSNAVAIYKGKCCDSWDDWKLDPALQNPIDPGSDDFRRVENLWNESRWRHLEATFSKSGHFGDRDELAANSANSARVTPAASAVRTEKVNHFLSPTGAWLRRFNAVQKSIDKEIQLKCTDTVESSLRMAVTDDNSIGVALTIGLNTRRYCAVVFDPSTYAILGNVPLPLPQPLEARGVAISPDGKTAYVIAPDLTTRGVLTSTLYFIDLAKMTVSGTVTFDKNRLQYITVTPDGARLFLTESFVFRTNPIVVVDTATQTASNLPVNPSEGIDPSWVVMHPNGTKLYLIDGNPGTHPLGVLDTSTGALTLSHPFGNDSNVVRQVSVQSRGNPQFTPDGRFLLAMGDGLQVTVIDTVTDSVAGRLPRPADSPGSSGLPALGFFFVAE